MKFLTIIAFATLASTPALAQQTTIFADNETVNTTAPAAPAPATEGDSISVEGFNGGVSTNDTHEGNGGMVIQMLMPNTASAVTNTPGPFVSRAAVTGGSH